MAAVVPTIISQTVLSGKRLLILTATIANTSSTFTLSLATHGVRTLYGIFVQIEDGMDGDFQTVQASFSGLDVTLKSLQADGGAADEWTDTTVRILCIVD